MSKDRAFRIYGKHKDTRDKEEMDEELKVLEQDEKDKEKQVALAKAKREKRERIASLLVQKTHGKRRCLHSLQQLLSFSSGCVDWIGMKH